MSLALVAIQQHNILDVTSWSQSDWLTFVGSVAVVSTAMFGVLSVMTNKAFDLWGLVRMRARQVSIIDAQDHTVNALQSANGTVDRKIASAIDAYHVEVASSGDHNAALQAALTAAKSAALDEQTKTSTSVGEARYSIDKAKGI